MKHGQDPQPDPTGPADPLEWNPDAGASFPRELALDIYRDASAVLRGLARHDAEGAHIVMTNTDAPRHVALALATIVLHVCHLAGLDDDDADRLITQITTALTNAFLDQANDTSGEVHGA